MLRRLHKDLFELHTHTHVAFLAFLKQENCLCMALREKHSAADYIAVCAPTKQLVPKPTTILGSYSCIAGPAWIMNTCQLIGNNFSLHRQNKG